MAKTKRKQFKFLEFITLEFLLTRWGWPNGAEVIVVRSAWLSISAYGFVQLAFLAVDPARSEIGVGEMALRVVSDIEKLGVLFGAFYAVFYTRFSSQWTYLANLYNQIKRTQSALPENLPASSKAAMVEWKAGFLEDAFALHLANKPTLSETVRLWLEDAEVRDAFCRFTPHAGHYLRMIGFVVKPMHPNANGEAKAETKAESRPRDPAMQAVT
jgi:hypothetical protein